MRYSTGRCPKAIEMRANLSTGIGSGTASRTASLPFTHSYLTAQRWLVITTPISRA